MIAIALDDEPPALRVIAHYASQTEDLQLARTFMRPSEALRYLKRNPVDVLLTDIKMPSISGIDFVKELPRDILVIFTTAHSEYAVEGFNLNALDYLLKPFSLERFQAAIGRAREQLVLRKQPGDPLARPFFLIRADYQLHKVFFDELLYAEGLSDYVRLHLAARRQIVARITMKELMEKLTGGDFMRTHKSYIVSLPAVERFKGRELVVAGKALPIGATYEEEFLRRMRVE
jgi:DNA-binding LytR/AlgR family response regulator